MATSKVGELTYDAKNDHDLQEQVRQVLRLSNSRKPHKQS